MNAKYTWLKFIWDGEPTYMRADKVVIIAPTSAYAPGAPAEHMIHTQGMDSISLSFTDEPEVTLALCKAASQQPFIAVPDVDAPHDVAYIRVDAIELVHQRVVDGEHVSTVLSFGLSLRKPPINETYSTWVTYLTPEEVFALIAETQKETEQ